MKSSPNKHIYFLQSLLISTSISIFYLDRPEVFIKSILINIFIFTSMSFISWKKVKLSFEKIYGKENHFSGFEQKHRFGGIQLSTRDNSGLKDFFLEHSLVENKKIKSYIISFALYIFYVSLNLWQIPIQEINQFQVGLAAILLIFFQRINFWGAYLLYTCLSLILFCINIDLTGGFAYLIFIFFIIIFFVQFKELTRWYWANITKEVQEKINLKGVRELTNIVLLFCFIFVLTDYHISNKASLFSILVNKLLSSEQSVVIKDKLIKQISSFDSDTINNKQIKIQINELKKKIQKLEGKKVLNLSEQELLLKHIQKHLSLKKQNNQNEIASLLNQTRSSTVAKNQKAEQILKTVGFQNKNMLQGPEFLSLIQSINATNDKISVINKKGSINDASIIKQNTLTNKKLRLAQELEQMSKANLKTEKILSPTSTRKLQEMIDRKLSESVSKVPSQPENIKIDSINQEKIILLIKKELVKTSTNKDLSEKEKNITKELLNERLQSIRLTQLKNDNILIEDESDALEIMKRGKANAEAKSDKKMSFFKFLFYSITGIFLFNLFYSLFKKNKGSIKHEELSAEQKERIRKVFSKKAPEFDNFVEEVNFKYKLFYQFIEISFYSPTYPPPPAIISLETSMVPSKDIRSVAHILSIFFNSVNYGGRVDFSKKDVRAFRSQYNKFKKHLSKIL